MKFTYFLVAFFVGVCGRSLLDVENEAKITKLELQTCRLNNCTVIEWVGEFDVTKNGAGFQKFPVPYPLPIGVPVTTQLGITSNLAKGNGVACTGHECLANSGNFNDGFLDGTINGLVNAAIGNIAASTGGSSAANSGNFNNRVVTGGASGSANFASDNLATCKGSGCVANSGNVNKGIPVDGTPVKVPVPKPVLVPEPVPVKVNVPVPVPQPVPTPVAVPVPVPRPVPGKGHKRSLLGHEECTDLDIAIQEIKPCCEEIILAAEQTICSIAEQFEVDCDMLKEFNDVEEGEEGTVMQVC